ncbi:MAG: hydantoinase/oxoprolinase family protein [Paracoccaceae bacterium]|nr:hydantoinase/oxoprolinase family protein [Paracoccaceae bacterium]
MTVLSILILQRIPVRTALTGPPAKVSSIGRIFAQHKLGDLITFELGGTCTDIAILPHVGPGFTDFCEIAGYPVLTPMVDLEITGAGAVMSLKAKTEVILRSDGHLYRAKGAEGRAD